MIKSRTMTEALLPYEVRRLIFNHLDLETLKALRQVSTSWATVGTELLLLPTYVVKSYSIDVPRLINIGGSQNVAPQAARFIKKIEFHSTDWDASYLRCIFCSRHTHLSNYEVVDFVPTQEEQQAFDELDTVIERRTFDDIQEVNRVSLTRALRQTPQVDTIEVTCPNPFKHRLLRKVWDEYAMETYRSLQLHQGSSQLVDILSAAKEAGLEIRHIRHDQLTSYFFSGEDDLVPSELYAYLRILKTLSFTVIHLSEYMTPETLSESQLLAFKAILTPKYWHHSDVPHDFLPNKIATTRLHRIISAPPELESVHIKFEALFPVSLNFLPEALPSPTKLRALTIFGVRMDSVKFFSFLEMQADTLKYLSISSAELVETDGSWQEFLELMRDKFGCTLEKFQLAGILRRAEPGGKTWLLSPIYKNDWTELEYSVYRNSGRTRDVENFVLRGGPFPMTDEDDISSLLA